MLALLIALLAPPAFAATPAEILEDARAAQRVDSSIQELRMVLVSRTGSERVRELEMRVRKEGDVLKSYTRFSAPSDVAGTQLVIVDNPDQADDQLLYLPALKRVNRISGKARSGSFMGSDFTFEDFELTGGGSSEGATMVREDDKVWVIEARPGPDSSYSRLVLTVDKVDKLPKKVEYFDQKGAPLKVLEVLEVSHEGNLTFTKISVMKNLQKGTETRLEVKSQRMDVGEAEIPDETFTAAYMERQG